LSHAAVGAFRRNQRADRNPPPSLPLADRGVSAPFWFRAERGVSTEAAARAELCCFCSDGASAGAALERNGLLKLSLRFAAAGGGAASADGDGVGEAAGEPWCEAAAGGEKAGAVFAEDRAAGDATGGEAAVLAAAAEVRGEAGGREVFLGPELFDRFICRGEAFDADVSNSLGDTNEGKEARAADAARPIAELMDPRAELGFLAESGLGDMAVALADTLRPLSMPSPNGSDGTRESLDDKLGRLGCADGKLVEATAAGATESDSESSDRPTPAPSLSKGRTSPFRAGLLLL